MSKIEVGLWAFFAGALGGFLVTYAWATHGHEGEIEAIRTRADSVAEAERGKQLLARNRLAVLQDSLNRLEARTTSLEIERREAGSIAKVTGDSLEGYLAGNATGLRLWREHKAADQHLAELWQDERNAWMQQIEMRVQMEQQLRNIIASQDTELVALRANFNAMQAQAERWRLKAEPPLLIRLFKGGLECGAGGAAAWGLTDDPLVGFGAGGACLLAKEVMP